MSKSKFSGPNLKFPIVALGASAGGLKAFEAFFSGIPKDEVPGMAFVLIQHLSPNHKSLLSEIMDSFTNMPVSEIKDATTIEPNHVYVIPPGHNMGYREGVLELLPVPQPRSVALPIDYFFQTLADELGEQSIGVILSGTGSDGTLGSRAIKEAGGLVIVQSLNSVEFDGMPKSLIEAGLADVQLNSNEIWPYLKKHFNEGRIRVPGLSVATVQQPILDEIFKQLSEHTGHDFSKYKTQTIFRRIERQMKIQNIPDIKKYALYLKENPEGRESLFNDLLIGVTRFFRDQNVFQELEEKIIPKILQNHNDRSLIRVWCAGCSTGEEAYSIAILFSEAISKLKKSIEVQIFATDIDKRALAVARLGLYPAGIMADVSAQRLNQFFSHEAESDKYRIQKDIRNMLVFSEHDLLKDPPFSKMDLVSCRNLFIYFNSELQKYLIPVFHYALRPQGVLLLGNVEGVGEDSEYFSIFNAKLKVFQRQEGVKTLPRLSSYHPKLKNDSGKFSDSKFSQKEKPAKLSMRELTELTLLDQVVPPSALVEANGDILYMHGRAGLFLEPVTGEARSSNIVTMARLGLAEGLAAALRESVMTSNLSQRLGLNVKTNGHFTKVNLTVRPVMINSKSISQSLLYLISLQEVQKNTEARDVNNDESDQSEDESKDLQSSQQELKTLRMELLSKDDHLKRIFTELNSSTEALAASNEELQSVNEELQSTNEELETSKEELQSLNEELSTVNSELHSKVNDLQQANNDLNNLLAGTGIATIFLNLKLEILRFTPSTREIVNFIATDVGRPLGHIKTNLLNYERLVEDAQTVLDTLKPIDLEVQSIAGKWHFMRLRPYRTQNRVVEGIVITFVEITEAVRTREELHKANDQLRLAVVVRDSYDAITVQDLTGKILAWNPGATRAYGWSEAEALAMNTLDRIPPNQQKNELEQLRHLSQTKVFEPYKTQRLQKSGAVVDVTIISSPMIGADGEMYAIATTERLSKEIKTEIENRQAIQDE